MEDNVAAAIRFALDVAFQATVLLSLTALALAALRRASASVRQLVATLGLAGALALPAVTAVAPRWRVPLVPSLIPAASPMPAAARSQAAIGEERRSAAMAPVSSSAGPKAFPDEIGGVRVASEIAPAARTPASEPRRSPVSWMLAVLAFWSAGTLVALAALALGAARVAKIRDRASDDIDESWSDLLASLSERLGVTRIVRLVFTEELAVPVTIGLSRPIVLLPESARRWNEERRQVVLLHELAHVKRADWACLLVGQLAGALYWFHPLAWSIRIRMRKDCERACDDLVLAAGTRASVYAAHLLSIIRSLRLSKQRTLSAVAMARRSYWDGRMRAILDPSVERRVVSRKQARVAAGVLFGAVLALAVLEPWATPKAAAMASDRSSFLAVVESNADDDTASCAKKERASAQPAVIREKDRKPAPSIGQAVAPEADDDPNPGFVKASGKHRGGGSRYERGMDLHHDERYDEAIEAFKKSIEEGERVEAATYNIACGYARKGDADRAFEWLNKAIDAGFEVDSYLAKDDDLDVLRSDPRFAELRRTARERKIEESRHEAERLAQKYERLKASPSTKGSAFYEIGKDLLEVGRYDLAAQAFEASAARGHREGASLYNTACALSLKGDRARALDYLQKALEAGFDDPSLVRRDDDLDNVRGDPRYRELLKMADDLELHRFHDRGDKFWSRSARRAAWREVEQHFDEYTRAHPQSGRAWFNLGYARIEADRPAEASEAFRRALDLGYRKATTMYNLACAYSLLERQDEAFGWLFKALDAGFEGEGMLRSDDDLDNLRGDPRFRQALARAKEHEGDKD